MIGVRAMKSEKEEAYYLVRKDLLPEVIVKTVEVKQLIDRGEADTIFAAVQQVGMSRSAFYKYRDGVFPFNAMMKEKIIVISFNLEHRSGILSRVLRYIAETGSSILTINQSIPLQGIAHVTMSIDTNLMEGYIGDMMDGLSEIEGVHRATIIGRG